jgi:hypothetical protein
VYRVCSPCGGGDWGVNTGSNLTGCFKEGYGSKRAVVPMIMTMTLLMIQNMTRKTLAVWVSEYSVNGWKREGNFVICSPHSWFWVKEINSITVLWECRISNGKREYTNVLINYNVEEKCEKEEVMLNLNLKTCNPNGKGNFKMNGISFKMKKTTLPVLYRCKTWLVILM